MEIVLQWVDDLEDLLFAAALASERLRHTLLQVGLLAALALVAASLLPAGYVEPVLAAGVALASVAAWLVGSLCAAGGLRTAALKNADSSLT